VNVSEGYQLSEGRALRELPGRALRFAGFVTLALALAWVARVEFASHVQALLGGAFVPSGIAVTLRRRVR